MLRASGHERLTRHAEEDINVLVIVLKDLQVSYLVAEMFLRGFEHLRVENDSLSDDDDFYTDISAPGMTSSSSIDWMRYFPYPTTQTSGPADGLLTKHNDAPFLDQAWLGLSPLQMQEPFGQFESFPIEC